MPNYPSERYVCPVSVTLLDMSSQADLLSIVEQLAVSVAELENWRNSFSQKPPSPQGPFAEVESAMAAQRLEAERELAQSREVLAEAEREYAALLAERSGADKQ
jgi:hypothetical protein